LHNEPNVPRTGKIFNQIQQHTKVIHKTGKIDLSARFILSQRIEWMGF